MIRRELAKSLILQFLEIVGLMRRRKKRQKKYQDLRRELQKIWNVRVKIIPLVVGSLDAIIPEQFGID